MGPSNRVHFTSPLARGRGRIGCPATTLFPGTCLLRPRKRHHSSSPECKHSHFTELRSNKNNSHPEKTTRSRHIIFLLPIPCATLILTQPNLGNDGDHSIEAIETLFPSQPTIDSDCITLRLAAYSNCQ